MTVPNAGTTHDVVLSKGAVGAETFQGLMVKGGLEHYSCQPYTPFAPNAREGEATNRDLSLPAVWELQQDWSGGVGKYTERKTEDNGYALSIPNSATGSYFNTKTGSTLFTGLAGVLAPPPALTDAGTVANVKQFIEFKSALYFVTSDDTRKLYKYDATGVTPSEVTLPATPAEHVGKATQLYTDGASLYITQGASKSVLVSTDGAAWDHYQISGTDVNADFLCVREDGALAYVAGATLTPGAGVAGTATYTATTIGATGTTATGMVFFKGALWIGKPEGLFSWYQGKVDKRFDAMEHQSTTNFTKMAIHHDLLYFNVKNQLFYTDGDRYVQIFPNDAGGFANLSCMYATSGSLLLGGKLLNFAGGQSAAYLPGTVVDDSSVGTTAWTNPTNATAQDGNYATAALASTSVTKSPTVVTQSPDPDRGASTAWTNPNNALTSNDQYATCTLLPTNYSYLLQLRHYDFAIPTDAQILGIAVTLEGNISSASAQTYIRGCIVKGGVHYGETAYYLPATEISETSWTIGGSDTLFETTWTAADVNADNFGVDIQVYGSAARTYNLDTITITVYYLPQSHYLKCTNFGVSLPTSAVPVGVMVEVETENAYCREFSARLVVSGTIVGDTKTAVWSGTGTREPEPTSVYQGGEISSDVVPYTGGWIVQSGAPDVIRPLPAEADVVVGFGGMAQLWGLALTRADVVASSFGVVISASKLASTVRIDSVKLTIFYTLLDTALEQLYMFWGPDAPGLNPLWGDNDGTHPTLAAGATSVFDATGERIYFCCNDAWYTNKIHYLSVSPRFWPTTFRTDTIYTSCIELTEFSAGFRTVLKWWYELEINVRDPLGTTFAKVEYCVDNGAWRWVVDENGMPKTLTLSQRIVGAYFPRDLRGTYLTLRIHLWTTNATSVAKITHITLRGVTTPKVRYQFSFPADCSDTVPNLTIHADRGPAVRDFIRAAAAQGYPCKFQDPWGAWHLVKHREPSPMDVIEDSKKPHGNEKQKIFGSVQVVLVEVDALDAYGDMEEWKIG